MALTNQPSLNIVLEVSDDCTEIYLSDQTGTYNATTNVTGYGLPGGPASADVERVTVTATPHYLSTTLVYVFTVNTNVITAATLSVGGATPVSILSALPSTVWPFTEDEPFELFKNYGVTIPSLIDDVIQVDYNIWSDTLDEEFDFTNTKFSVAKCSLECCAKRKDLAIDPTCECANAAYSTSVKLHSLLNTIDSAADLGDLQAALDAFDEASRMCSSDNEDCGC